MAGIVSCTFVPDGDIISCRFDSVSGADLSNLPSFRGEKEGCGFDYGHLWNGWRGVHALPDCQCRVGGFLVLCKTDCDWRRLP